MCLSCGCGEPNDDHGNPDNITYTDLQKAAQAGGVDSVEEAADNIHSGTVAIVGPDSDDDEDEPYDE